MRHGEGEKIGRALIDHGPDYAASEGGHDQPDVGQMQRCKNRGHQEHTQPAFSQNQLRAPIDETLEDVLLRQPPTKTQSQLYDDRSTGMPRLETCLSAEPAAQSKTYDRHQYHRQHEEQSRLQKVIKAKAEVAQG